MKDSVSESGLLASLRRLLATALEIAQVRVDLLGTEIEFEKRRIFDGLLWAAISLLVLGIGLVLLCGFVILLFWEGYRLSALGILALLFLTSGAALIYRAGRFLRNKKNIFNASLSELERDRAELISSGQHGYR